MPRRRASRRRPSRAASANYGPLNIACHRINTDLIARNWDELLRVASSLKLGLCQRPRPDAHLPDQRSQLNSGAGVG
ncbi:MAG: Tn3 family transposase [Chloroflexota bacterium]